MGWWKQKQLMRKKYMSENWVADMAAMHAKYGVNEWFFANKHDQDLMRKYLMFRLLMCQEELHETMQAANSGNAEEVVDGLIDLCVFAIGTLDVFNVDANKAWDQVYGPNMNKQVGVKPGRPNPFGLPDLLKPGGWQGPDHSDNHGDLSSALDTRPPSNIDKNAW
jgi:predicted HAD superfamily Cof-like phosphohydrolase